MPEDESKKESKENSETQTEIKTDQVIKGETNVSDIEDNKSKLITSSLLGSIDDLLEETQKELGNINDEVIPLDLETVKEVWNTHKESVESPSTKATLEKVIISIDDEVIHVIAPSTVSKEEIAQELHLYQKLRDKFNNKLLNIIIEVDRSQFPELSDQENTRMYTMKEKYDYLVKKNPELNNLVEALKLKVDQE